MGLLAVFLVSLAAMASASPHGRVKRQVSELRKKYDFVIVGGGTSGLTVADRLSQAFPKKTVLVIEYGEVEYAPALFDPPTNWITAPPDAPATWTFNSLPNPEMDDRAAFVQAGQVVGGSSAVNGMFVDRGSRFDYDAWHVLSGSTSIPWDWDALYPWFKKSVTFSPPTPELAAEYNYTWDTSAYGGSTPIDITYPPYQWADQFLLNETWQDMGIKVNRECADGDKDGICWVPTTQDPVTARRSHSGLGHYAEIIDGRDNYDLLVKHQAIRFVYPKGGLKHKKPPLVEVRSLDGDEDVFNVTAKAEVILSAGALHTPTVLQRSGIGPASFLESAGIPVLLDLPGVGSNLHDHSGPIVTWTYPEPPEFSPVPADMLDPDFKADATAGFDEVPARGPYTMAGGNSAIYVPLPNITSDYHATIVSQLEAMAANPSLGAQYLPADLQSEPSIVAGYAAQLGVLAGLLGNPHSPSMETPWATDGSALAFLLHPSSRGTVRLNLTAPLEQPILDYRAGSNPVDFDLHLAHIKYLRELVNTDTLQSYGAVEVGPGPDVQTDEELLAYIKQQSILSFMHPCCTAAMMPREHGGVVGPDLKVHGAPGLRVVDMSVMPVVPAAHLSTTAYAVSEKAAAIIIDNWS